MSKSTPRDFAKKAAKPTQKVLTSEVASAATDPNFYSALQVLPNPDAVLRKLGRDQSIYDAISYDSHVMGELRAIYGALLKNEWRLLAGGDAPEDTAALELCIKVFNEAPAPNSSWSNFIWNVYQAVFRGYTVGEVIWSKQDRFLVPSQVLDKPNRRFAMGNERELRVLSKGNLVHGDPVDDLKFLLTRHMPDYDNPYGKAVFSSCFWPYTFKHNGMRWYSKLIQRFAIPSTVARYSPGTTDAEQDALLDAVVGMIEDNAIVVPQGTEVELIQLTGSAHAPHEGFINLCNREMSKALTSQTLASEVTEAGSRSTAGVQKERSDDNSEADREMVQRTMQKLVDWICALNFPNAKRPIWQFYDEKDVTAAEVDTLDKASKLVPLRRDEVYERLQLGQPQEGDEVVFTGGNSTPQNFTRFTPDASSFDFTSRKNEPLNQLANQGVKQAKSNFNAMLNAIRTAAEKADDLDALDDALPDLLDDVGVDEFVSAMTATRSIAGAAGMDDAAGDE